MSEADESYSVDAFRSQEPNSIRETNSIRSHKCSQPFAVAVKSRSLPITGALSAVGPRLQRRDQHRVRCSPRVWQPPADRSNRPGWMDDPPAALFEADIRPVPAAATPPPREWSRVAHGNSRACNLALALTRSAVSKPSLKEP